MRTVHIARTWILTFALATVSCGSVVRDGTGTSFLIVNRLEAASGAEPNQFAGALFSDVSTVVDDRATVYADMGRVEFQLGLKDPGTAANPNQPSQNQFITVDRYRVRYVRADGRNTQGIDVPYGFDGSFTATVGEGVFQVPFTLVRHVAKEEAPLAALSVNGVIISTLAEITFYGRDQTGRETSATATISVDFGNFADPN